MNHQLSGGKDRAVPKDGSVPSPRGPRWPGPCLTVIPQRCHLVQVAACAKSPVPPKLISAHPGILGHLERGPPDGSIHSQHLPHRRHLVSWFASYAAWLDPVPTPALTTYKTWAGGEESLAKLGLLGLHCTCLVTAPAFHCLGTSPHHLLFGLSEGLEGHSPKVRSWRPGWPRGLMQQILSKDFECIQLPCGGTWLIGFTVMVLMGLG